MSNGFKFDFTEEKLRHLLPRVKNVSEWYDSICETLPQYNIDDIARVPQNPKTPSVKNRIYILGI